MACRTEGTSAWAQATSSHRSTTTAVAPLAATAGANTWPSVCSPGTQKNREPGRTSADRQVTSTTGARGSPRTSAPGSASSSRPKTVAGTAGEGQRSVVKAGAPSARTDGPPDDSSGAGSAENSSIAPSTLTCCDRVGRNRQLRGRSDSEARQRKAHDLLEKRRGGDAAIHGD